MILSRVHDIPEYIVCAQECSIKQVEAGKRRMRNPFVDGVKKYKALGGRKICTVECMQGNLNATKRYASAGEVLQVPLTEIGQLSAYERLKQRYHVGLNSFIVAPLATSMHLVN